MNPLKENPEFESPRAQLRALLAPFRENELEWRVQRSGMSGGGKPWAMVLCYVQARAVMDRLDYVFGPDGWEDSYRIISIKGEDGETFGVECRLTVTYAEGDVMTKTDVSQVTDVEPLKGGYSSALKRAAVKVGIGRYLYEMPTSFADLSTSKAGMKSPNMAKIKGTNYFWPNPRVPSKFLPDEAEF